MTLKNLGNNYKMEIVIRCWAKAIQLISLNTVANLGLFLLSPIVRHGLDQWYKAGQVSSKLIMRLLVTCW